jgi:NitT/TauT family transport system permease protein
LDKTTTLPLSAAGQPEAHDPKRDFEAKPEKAVNRTERRGMAVVRARESRSASIMQSLALPVLVLLLWEIAGRAGFIMSGILPYPSLVAQGWWTWAFGENAMGLNAYSGTWAENAFNSFERVAKGYLVAIVVAVPIGIIIGWSRMAARLIDPTIQSMRPIPITAWLPFSIALFGIRDFGAIFLIALGAFYPIVVNTTHGARDVNSNLIRAAAMMGANRWQMLFRVVFPSALPAIFTGMRIGLGIAWTAVIVAEMVAVKSGLGYVLWDAYYVGRMDIVIADMVSIGLLGFITDWLIVQLQNYCLKWKQQR